MIKQNRVKLLLATLIFALASVGSTRSMAVGVDSAVDAQTDSHVLKNELITRTLARLKEEASKEADSQENKRRAAIAALVCARLAQCASAASASIPGCCLYQGDNYLAQVVAIAEKQERVAAAIKYINSVGNIDQAVCDYFQRTFQKLKSGINVPLPDYFHATDYGFANIIASKAIKQSTGGAAGEGTYMSSNNEGDCGYGPYAFAIDSGALVDTKASFFRGRGPGHRGSYSNVFSSLWAAVLKDIPVAENSIAFIDTKKGDSAAHIKEMLEKQNLDIEVVDRKTSEEILRIFDLATEKRELPSFDWKCAGGDGNIQYSLSENMTTRSLEGLFTEYTFGDGLTVAFSKSGSGADQSSGIQAHDTQLVINKRQVIDPFTGALCSMGAVAAVGIAYMVYHKQKTASVGMPA